MDFPHGKSHPGGVLCEGCATPPRSKENIERVARAQEEGLRHFLHLLINNGNVVIPGDE